jgi:hypothetical protein
MVILWRLLAQKSCASLEVTYVGYSADEQTLFVVGTKTRSSFVRRLWNVLRRTKKIAVRWVYLPRHEVLIQSFHRRAAQVSGLHVILPLTALNHSGITQLSLHNLNWSREDWTSILGNTTLPSLTHLSLIPTYSSAGCHRVSVPTKGDWMCRSIANMQCL